MDTVKAFFKSKGIELNAKSMGKAIVIHEVLGITVLGKPIEKINMKHVCLSLKI